MAQRDEISNMLRITLLISGKTDLIPLSLKLKKKAHGDNTQNQTHL